jgi:hypothetical protein
VSNEENEMVTYKVGSSEKSRKYLEKALKKFYLNNSI